MTKYVFQNLTNRKFFLNQVAAYGPWAGLCPVLESEPNLELPRGSAYKLLLEEIYGGGILTSMGKPGKINVKSQMGINSYKQTFEMSTLCSDKSACLSRCVSIYFHQK